MKKLIISILIGMTLIFTSVASAVEFNKLAIETDEFTGVTSKKMCVNSVEGIFIINSYNFDVDSDYRLCLMIILKNKSWKYLRCNHVYFSIDGKKLSPHTKYKRGVGNRYGFEYIKLSNPGEIRTILEGTDVKFKICRDVYEIPTKELKLLRQVLN